MSDSQDIERLETSEHVIMCVDILGYQEMLAKEKNKKEHKDYLLNKINELFELAISASKIPEVYTGKNNRFITKMTYHIYSDNLIFAIKLNGQNTFKAFDDMLTQAWLLQQVAIDKGMILRGGITTGEFYYNETSGKNFVYGQGLVDAYTLESKVAVDPKIVVDEIIFKRLNGELEKLKHVFDYSYFLNSISKLCTRDENGAIFVDYIMGLTFDEIDISCIKSEFDLKLAIGEKSFEEFISDFNTHKKLIEENLKKHRYNDKNSDTKKYTDRVFKKYQWMRDYHNRCCKKLCLNEEFLIEIEYEDLFNSK